MNTQQFGATIKAKYPVYSKYSDEEIGKRMLQKYPQYQDRVSNPVTVGGVAGNAVGDVKSLVGGLAGLPGAVMGSMKETGTVEPVRNIANLAGKAIPGVVGEYGDLIQHPIKHATEHPVNTVMDLLPFLKLPAALSKTASVTKAVSRPMKTVNAAIESKAATAGRTTWDQILSKFDNPDLTKGIGTAADQSKIQALIKQEKAGIASNYGNANVNKGPLYSDVLNLRRGAGKKAYVEKGVPKTLDQDVAARFQGAYSSLLKEGAETGGLDKLYTVLSKAKGATGHFPGVVKYYLTYRLLSELLNKFTKK